MARRVFDEALDKRVKSLLKAKKEREGQEVATLKDRATARELAIAMIRADKAGDEGKVQVLEQRLEKLLARIRHAEDGKPALRALRGGVV